MVKKRNVRRRVERLQAAFKPFRSADGSAVDELIAERRGEAQQGNQENLAKASTGKRPDVPDSSR